MLPLFLALAHGQTLQQQVSGPLIELAAGPAMVGPPVRFAVAGHGSLGWWFGRYDDAYALGRFNAFAVTQRIDWVPAGNGIRSTSLLEFRRGMDLFVVAPHFLIGAGAVVAGGEVGGAVRIGGGLKLRRSRRLGIVARLAGGIDWIGGTFAPALSLTFGAGWSSPVQKLKE